MEPFPPAIRDWDQSYCFRFLTILAAPESQQLDAYATEEDFVPNRARNERNEIPCHLWYCVFSVMAGGCWLLLGFNSQWSHSGRKIVLPRNTHGYGDTIKAV